MPERMGLLAALIALGSGLWSLTAHAVDAPPDGVVPLVWSDATGSSLPSDPHVDSGSWRVGVVQGDFTMVGLLWDSGRLDSLWLQVVDETGRWGPWTEVVVSADHGDEDASARPGSSPVYTGRATAARWAASGEVQGAEAMMIDTEATPTPTARPFAATADDPVPVPTPWWPGPSFVRDRSAWDTENCRRPGETYHFSTPRAIVIHHTAAGNNYSAADVPGIIRGHCLFHVNGRGWDDLAYNFMVDKFGTVWEGRTASKTTASRGGHTAGFNGQTQGIAMMGNYATTAPGAAQMAGLRTIVDWLAGWHSIDPRGWVTLYADAGNTRGWARGQPVDSRTIIGHRDLGTTSCPGQAFYAAFPTLRAAITPTSSGVDPTTVSCQGRRPTIYGTPGHDQIRGTPSGDVIHGMGGSDLILGMGGNDLICGGGGNDHLISGSGMDSVAGGPGTDTCGAEGRATCELLDNSEMFFYREDGLFRYYDIRSDGKIPKPMLAGTGYTRDWTSISAIDLDGDGQDELFFYREDGLFRYYDVNPDGTLGPPIHAGEGYTKGWSSITAVDLNGDRQDEIIFYREDGLFRFYDIGETGTLGAPIISGSGYTRGWSSITAIDLDGDSQDELFFYRDDGLFRYYQVASGGHLPSPSMGGDGYTRDWSSITSVDLDGDAQDEIFFYRDDGLFRYYQIDANGEVGSPMAAGTAYTRGWSSIAAVELDHRPYVTPNR